MTPSRQAAIFEAYASMITLVSSQDTLNTIATQCHDDRRLTENQRDALLALLEARTNILQSGRLHRGPT